MYHFRLPTALLFMLAALLVGACQDSESPVVTRTDEGVLRLGSVQAVDTVDRAVAPNERPLVLDGIRGSVRLTGADQATADLSFVRRGRGETPEAARSVLEETSITEQGTEDTYTFTLQANDNEDYAAVDIEGQVPRRAALQIDRLSGPVHLDGVEGALTIEHEHGNVNVRGAAAPVEVDVKNGSVHVGFQSVPEEGTTRLRTVNGDIQIDLPPAASAQIDARTDAGTIRTQGASFTAEQLALVNAGARYEAQMEDGGPTIELRTQNGSITLRSRAAEETDTTQVEKRPAPEVPSADTVVPPAPDTQQVDTISVDTTSAGTTSADTSLTGQDTVSVNPNR